MLIKEINGIDLEPLQGGFRHGLDMTRPAVEAVRSATLELETELGRNSHLAVKGCQSFAHEFLVGERAVNLSGVEEIDAEFHGAPNHGNHFGFLAGWAEAEAHAHAAEAHRGDLQIAAAKFALLNRLNCCRAHKECDVSFARRNDSGRGGSIEHYR